MVVAVGQIIDPLTFRGDRDVNIEQMNAMNKIRMWDVMAWGCARKGGLTHFKERYFRYRVSGFKHKGFVYVMVNAGDTYDLHFTTLQNKVKKVKTDIYIDEYFPVMNKEIEGV